MNKERKITCDIFLKEYNTVFAFEFLGQLEDTVRPCFQMIKDVYLTDDYHPNAMNEHEFFAFMVLLR